MRNADSQSRLARRSRKRSAPATPDSPRRHRRLLLILAVLIAAAVAAVPAVSAGAGSTPQSAQEETGLSSGKIKHVWLIILENKSYDASFTGLNKNTYLWQELPKQGALLKNYYGTGHFSLDNYISMVSGQATQPDTQADCPDYDKFSGAIKTEGTLASNENFGQFASLAGPNAIAGSNGCVYPENVPTLFNQLDSAGKSWKGYAQDLGNTDTLDPGEEAPLLTHSTGPTHCGAPYAEPGPTGSTAFKNPGGANSTDQYVPKHFPFPWFESILKSGDCNSAHIANLFDPANGLYHDLQSAATTPAFSWISPNNCSDGHDAVCHGNNLSGGFSGPDSINAPVNYTGGLYAADLFLAHVIPEIEASPAFKEGGLIDVTFDEGFPPFTYTGNSFANSTEVTPTAQTSVESDSAAETLYGQSVHTEPTGPNTPLKKNANEQEIYPGPGDNAFLDRPANCKPQEATPLPPEECILGGGNPIGGKTGGGGRTDSGATAASGSTTIIDDSIVATDPGRLVTGTGIPTATEAFVGPVSDTPVTATAPAQSGGRAVTGSFTLVNKNREPIATEGAVSGVTLGGQTKFTDPLYDYGDPTTGGGDTGSVLISPYITPGTVSTRYYNHYSWLRTMEDLFEVGKVPAAAGLDGKGHLGYAAQPGLAPFGSDVFDNPNGPPAVTPPTPPAPAPTPTKPAPAPTPPAVPPRVFHHVGKQPKPAHHKKKHHKKHHKRKHHRHHHHKGSGNGHK